MRHNRRSTSTGVRVGQIVLTIGDQHGSEETKKKISGRTTTAAAAANSTSATLFGSLINMGFMAMSSGSILLCLMAAKRLI